MKITYVAVSILILLVFGAGVGFVFYANSLEPPAGPIEEVVPDDRLPR